MDFFSEVTINHLAKLASMTACLLAVGAAPRGAVEDRISADAENESRTSGNRRDVSRPNLKYFIPVPRENNFVASSNHFDDMASARRHCCGDHFTCYGDNCNCFGSYSFGFCYNGNSHSNN